jgi:hypothetical protein
LNLKRRDLSGREAGLAVECTAEIKVELSDSASGALGEEGVAGGNTGAGCVGFAVELEGEDRVASRNGEGAIRAAEERQIRTIPCAAVVGGIAQVRANAQ